MRREASIWPKSIGVDDVGPMVSGMMRRSPSRADELVDVRHPAVRINTAKEATTIAARRGGGRGAPLIVDAPAINFVIKKPHATLSKTGDSR